jgi:DNA polymerase-3 subunit epsilon
MKILYFDLETTGLDPSRDRIIEIGVVLEDESAGTRETYEALVNPGMPIPAESSAIHGINDEDVKDKAPIQTHLPKMVELFNACDAIGGYNVTFDLKVLMAEGRRTGTPFSLHSKEIWDMQKIFFHHEPRTLSAAAKFYCQKNIENAHRALVDVEATLDVFKAQREKYNFDLQNEEVKAYALASLPLDSNGAFAYNDKGQVQLNFGKFKGKVVVAENKEIRNYLSWMIGASFPPDSKAIARALLKGRSPQPEELEATILEFTH